MSVVDSEQKAPEPFRRMTRPMEGRLVGGVAGGLARQLKLDPVVIRLAFLLLGAVEGVGVVVYAVLWMITPREPHEGAPPSRDWSQLAAFTAIGIALFAFGWLTGASRGGVAMLPFAVGGIGALILWQQADPDRRTSWVSGATKGMRKNRVRTLLGVLLVVGGAIGFLLTQGALEAARSGLIFTVVVVGGLVVIALPWLAGLWKELQLERRERIRQEEKAEIAAMVHDSVLHTLTLIQRVAHDPREVTRLARSQERELRNWLYQPAQDADTTFAAAVRRIAAEEEDAHGIPVEIVCVGDIALDQRLDGMLKAFRQAMVNAGKYSDSPVISVYAEVEGQEVFISVKDRGKGFDMEAVPVDRMGIRESIIGRMERHGGTAKVRTEPGEGTEVMLTMKVET
ncbi:signal transduction histidine kinase/phage shock protein PspC (stress-responsive transcriptional regulator) [Nonomuraea soli]|uniref:Signal transduction histidine kinase/phage shock protein PspC (Stress-responsive transcriptional regulator) n=2 Tax=Nonomuraea soli TaxID=1032476 RepID=A0A7W0CU66_9ACTN|nr:signal transduction histidine kinase/phage shock protein PspC (stress-responsive transcriptional regulator) [Nonomuraea soli]